MDGGPLGALVPDVRIYKDDRERLTYPLAECRCALGVVVKYESPWGPSEQEPVMECVEW